MFLYLYIIYNILKETLTHTYLKVFIILNGYKNVHIKTYYECS